MKEFESDLNLKEVKYIKFHNDNENIVYYVESRIEVWNFRNKNFEIKVFENINDCCEINWKGNELVTLHNDGTIKIWNNNLKSYYKILNNENVTIGNNFIY